MGIPKFFRWLSERYPLINQTIDQSNPVPEFDALYLDMNGIVHACSHGHQDLNATVAITQEEVFNSVFQYMEILFNVAKPKKLLYVAVDGVAPRAKINQQRQRRFRAAREMKEKIEKARETGELSPSQIPFDSNCITPGTEFMSKLSESLKFFIRKKIKEDSAWNKITVIFSGNEVPGEGEHKIISHIRHLKSQPDWPPDTRHCMYGLDADLIMLALVTHDPYFALLREEGVLGRKKIKQDQQQFHLLHISVLREYLDLEFGQVFNNTLSFTYDLESVIDDFILLCFFIGNDFLPNLVGLDISERSLDELFHLYKELLPQIGGYLMENGSPVLDRLELVFRKLGSWERNFFAIGPPPDLVDRVSDRILRDNKEESALAHVLYPPGTSESGSPFSLSPLQRSGDLTLLLGSGSWGGDESDEDCENVWKNLYYRSHFQVELDNKKFHQDLRQCYLEAIFWVCHYYFHGCPSWSWYYPFHYPPLAIDMVNLAAIAENIKFDVGKPFLPLQQLLGVLPPDSAEFLPLPYRQLMINEESPLYKFYPRKFEVDLNDKKNDWEGIVLLPFIDISLIISETEKITDLTEVEKRRNEFGPTLAYTYNPKKEEKLISPLLFFPDIENCQTDVSEYLLPPIPTHVKQPFRLLPGVNLGTKGPMDIPTLKWAAVENVKPAHIHVDVFGNKSQKASLLLTLRDDYDPRRRDQIALKYLGKGCWLWPENREAVVETIGDASMEFCVNKSPKKFTERDTENWKKRAELIERKWKETKAVSCYASCIFSVRTAIVTCEKKKKMEFQIGSRAIFNGFAHPA